MKTYTENNCPKAEVFLDYTQHKPYFHIKFERIVDSVPVNKKIGNTEISGTAYIPVYWVHLSWFKFNKSFRMFENEMLNTGEVAK